MATTPTERRGAASRGLAALESVPLLETIVKRRSRRFALGHFLDGPPFNYRSRHEPIPLTTEEEAIIAFAGAGISGFSYGELPYAEGQEPKTGHGYVMVNPIARTVPSADGVNSVVPFILNDEGAFHLRRPQSFTKDEIPGLVDLAERREFTALYERMRVRVSDVRPTLPGEPLFVPPFNRWSTNVPGSTYFVLVSEVTTLALTIIFLILSEELGYTLYDERNGYRPAGLKPFGKSKGGHLHDDPNTLMVGTVLDFESYIMELAGVEQGLMLQNFQLAAEALGLGSFPHYGAQKWRWFEELGFRTEPFTFARLLGRGRVGTALMKAVRKNPTIPVPLGLEVDGEVTIKPYCPPWYSSMEEAVHAFVDDKFAEGRGALADGSEHSAWKDPAGMQAQMGRYSQANIDAVVAFCEYVHRRYGRFLGTFGPLRNLMAFQVHHLDTEFYDRFFKPGAYREAHRDHFAVWHGEDRAG